MAAFHQYDTGPRVFSCSLGGSLRFPSENSGAHPRRKDRWWSGCKHRRPSVAGTVYQVASLVIHPQYNSRTSDYDIAVLSVITPIVFGSGVQSIPLAPAGSGPVAGATSIFTGWGLTVEGGSASNVLQEVSLPIISQADCRAAYSVSSITDRMFCAGLLEEGGKDACHGDSGGPVVVGRLLTGLISWGNGCARPNTPAVNTNIPSMRQWILDTTGI
ncbi:hypothetical protein NQ317_004296 [Molorchus minor]|uniref:Peptidase S1 domain-containing protein n=1 Tax=Molorchus minor TaxID=1323400 RepID=A0ABQ9JEZ4_9CUCU|nr:hypothetical protein NQ317_004296 [Molorchus minor]